MTDNDLRCVKTAWTFPFLGKFFSNASGKNANGETPSLQQTSGMPFALLAACSACLLAGSGAAVKAVAKKRFRR